MISLIFNGLAFCFNNFSVFFLGWALWNFRNVLKRGVIHGMIASNNSKWYLIAYGLFVLINVLIFAASTVMTYYSTHVQFTETVVNIEIANAYTAILPSLNCFFMLHALEKIGQNKQEE